MTKIPEIILDSFDDKIISTLQRDSKRPLSEIASYVGLSVSATHRRIQLLDQSDVIQGYMARVSPRSIGLNLHAFVEISLSTQDQSALQKFEQAVCSFEQILECHLTSGSADYIIRIAARDMNDFDDIHRNCLARLPYVAKMQTSFSLREIRTWRGYNVSQ